ARFVSSKYLSSLPTLRSAWLRRAGVTCMFLPDTVIWTVPASGMAQSPPTPARTLLLYCFRGEDMGSCRGRRKDRGRQGVLANGRQRTAAASGTAPSPADLVFAPTPACRGVRSMGVSHYYPSPARPPRQAAGPGRAGLTLSRTMISGVRPVISTALRGSFCLRLASTFNHRPGEGAISPI